MKSTNSVLSSTCHIQIPLTSYVDLILCTTALATASSSTFEGAISLHLHYFFSPNFRFCFKNHTTLVTSMLSALTEPGLLETYTVRYKPKT